MWKPQHFFRATSSSHDIHLFLSSGACYCRVLPLFHALSLGLFSQIPLLMKFLWPSWYICCQLFSCDVIHSTAETPVLAHVSVQWASPGWWALDLIMSEWINIFNLPSGQCELQVSNHLSCLSDSELMQPELLLFLMERKENYRRLWVVWLHSVYHICWGMHRTHCYLLSRELSSSLSPLGSHLERSLSSIRKTFVF